MVDLDLHALAAPIEALRNEVDNAYERLDEKWQLIEEELKELPIPCTIGHCFSENEQNLSEFYRLEWRKCKGRKRMCVTYYNDAHDIEETTPYDEWGAEQKLKMLRFVPELFKDAVSQIKRFVESTKGEKA